MQTYTMLVGMHRARALNAFAESRWLLHLLRIAVQMSREQGTCLEVVCRFAMAMGVLS